MRNNIENIVMKKARLQKLCFKHCGQGFSTLLIVIIIGSISIGLMMTLSMNSLWSVKSSLNSKNLNKSKALVNACAEIALETLRENKNFTGSSSVIISGNTCDYIISNTGGDNRSITINSTVSGVVSKLQINTSAFNPIVISSWQEVQ
jgi:hypothetical protein